MSELPGFFLRCAPSTRRPAALSGQKLAKRLLDLISQNLVDTDVDMLEDGLIQFPSNFVAGELIQLVGILEKAEVGIDEVESGLEVAVERGEFVLELFAVAGDISELGSHLAGVQPTVCGKIDEVVFLGRQAGELALDLRAEQSERRNLIVEGSVHVGADGCNEVRTERYGAVVLCNGLFDAVHR